MDELMLCVPTVPVWPYSLLRALLSQMYLHPKLTAYMCTCLRVYAADTACSRTQGAGAHGSARTVSRLAQKGSVSHCDHRQRRPASVCTASAARAPARV